MAIFVIRLFAGKATGRKQTSKKCGQLEEAFVAGIWFIVLWPVTDPFGSMGPHRFSKSEVGEQLNALFTQDFI